MWQAEEELKGGDPDIPGLKSSTKVRIELRFREYSQYRGV